MKNIFSPLLFKSIRLALFLAGGAGAMSASAGGLANGPVSGWVKWQHQRPPAAECQQNPSGMEFLFHDEQVNVDAAEYFFHYAYQIVSQEGLAVGAEIRMVFDPEYQSVILHRLNVWRDGKAANHADADRFKIIQRERELSRQIVNGKCTALYFIPDIRVGDTVEVAVTVRGHNPIFNGHYSGEFGFNGGAPFREQTVRFIPAPGRAPVWRWLGGQPPTLTEERGGGELLWRANATPPALWDAGAPDWFPQQPSLQVTDFPSWSAVVGWALPIYQLPPSAGKLLREQAAKFRAAADDAEARAMAAVDFVQKEVRYLGMEMGAGSHRPSPPEVVLERRFGDCKDKTLLLVALLRELGVEAAPVLVNTSWRGRTGGLLPSAEVFDHVVTLVTTGGAAWLIDATAEYQAGARLADRHMGIYGSGLVVRAGEDGLTNFALGLHDTGSVEIKERVVVKDYAAPVTFSVATTYRGQVADNVRGFFATTAREQIAKSYRGFYSTSYPGLKTTGPMELRDDAAGNTLTVTEQYEIDNLFAPETPGQRQLVAEIGAAYLHQYLPEVNPQGRRAPLALTSYPRGVRVTTRVELPDDWPAKVETTRTDTPWFTYSDTQHRVSPRVVERQHLLMFKTDAVPLEQLDEYLAKRKQVVDQSGWRFTHSGHRAELNLTPQELLMTLMVVLGVFISVGALVVFIIYRVSRRSQPPPLLG
ncbi:MAG: DUF3857 domain-containing protein [Verrucomicrobiales bacterium]|jgi:transglutaminase-like putative cysteine protease|nr:DUF3857 domain-containing protein [Verrucomicrobiales bacterium]